MLSGDQVTIGKLKKDLEAKKKLSIELKDNVTKLMADKVRLLMQNGKLEADFKAK